MSSWEWETFASLLNNGTFTISDVGPLRSPLRSFTIRRDEKLHIVLETKAEQNARSSVPDHPLGTVRVNADTVLFSGPLGRAVAHGVQPKSHAATISSNPAEGESREASDVNSLEVTLTRKEKPIAYVIEWLANLDGPFVWPHFTKVKTEKIETRRLHDFANGIDLKSSDESEGQARNCVRFSVDGHTIYLGTCMLPDAQIAAKPGFVLYEGDPSREFRMRIVDCLSFALGVYLVRLGWSSLNEDSELVACSANRGYALSNRAFELPAQPPAPLGLKYQYEIDPAFLSRVVSALYKHYDSLRLGPLCWAYWHAAAATPHIAAVHYGAAVEALQAAYLEAHKGAIKTALIENDAWRALRGKFHAALDELSVNKELRQVLRNKIGTFNNPPQAVITERLLEVLKLQFGEREKNAWKRRNDAGHGNEIDSDDYIELIRDIKLLRIRLHKLLFAMTGASDSYNDDFTMGHAVRKLGEAIC